ncbi:ABC transporter substrate-binding protein, partial [Paenochrobactrum gallinarii]
SYAGRQRIGEAAGRSLFPCFLQVDARIAFMQMNSRETTPNKELQDIRVRKAISHAIDRKTMTEQIVGKGARVLNTFCFPSQFGCTDEGAVVYEYDPDKSKALLAEAGFANGLNLEIVAYRERDQTEAMINYLKAVGINVNLHFLQYAAMRELVRGDKVGLTHQTWGSFSVNDVSASTPVYMAFEGDDIVRDPEVRDLLKKGDTTIDPEERKAVYKQALTMIADKALVLPLYSLPVYYVTTADLEFKAYPDEMPRFWEMSWN